MHGKTAGESIRWGRIAVLCAGAIALVIVGLIALRAHAPAPPPPSSVSASQQPLAEQPLAELPAAEPLVTHGRAIPHGRPPQAATPRRGGAEGGEWMSSELPRVAAPDSDVGARTGERAIRLRDTRRNPRYFPDGSLAPSVVASEIDRRKRAIRSAYEHALRRDPTLAGQVEVRFTVGPSGQPSDIEVVRDSLDSPEVVERIKTVMPTWRFPTPAGAPQVYSYPFTFKHE
jgi:hypothetical protein